MLEAYDTTAMLGIQTNRLGITKCISVYKNTQHVQHIQFYAYVYIYIHIYIYTDIYIYTYIIYICK